MRLWEKKNVTDPSHRSVRRSPLGPGLFCWRFTTAARHLPHARTRLLHMPTKPKSKAPQSHPRSCFFRPHARFLLLACRASCWSSVLCSIDGLWCWLANFGPKPKLQCTRNPNKPPPLTEHKPKPALCAEGRETRLCVDARHPPQDTGALSRLFVSGDSRSRTGSRVRAPSGASPVSCTGSRLLTNDQQRQDMNPNEPGISQTAIGSELRAAELKNKKRDMQFYYFPSAKS